MNNTYSIIAIGFLLLQLDCFSQESPTKTVPLEDMSAFEEQSGNWFIVKDVTIDPTIDIHKKEGEEPKKKGKKKDQEPKAVTYESGTGILLNLPDANKKDHLITSWTHGDIELELEVMLPKGSNSGVYLQGRYEIQLLDSWGVKNASFSDIGGIYRNWESDPEKSYMGKAPLVNAAKAPGLWQKLKISFQAPRFDEEGNKTANARINSVELNGVRIHDYVEIPRVTGGAISQEEAAEGPLMIQGDHGPVAFRNIQYKLMKKSEVGLTNLTYKVYKGEFDTPEEVYTSKPEKSGSVDKLTHEVLDVENNFGIQFTGTLHIPEPGTYCFSAEIWGNGLLKINDEKVVLEGWRTSKGKVYLEKGSHPIELLYYKTEPWIDRRLGLTVSSDDTYPLDLHEFGSAPPDENMVSPIYINPGGSPRLLRAFLDFEGDRAKRLTHTIGVGEPANIHYVYNMNAGNLACIWKGEFVDATPMWHDRGDGSFVPRGMVQYLSAGPALAILPEVLAPFPEKTRDDSFKSTGYVLDQEGRPIFNYAYKDIDVSDKVYPDETASRFVREVNFSNVPENAFFRLAEGSEVEELSNGIFIIGDKSYFIKILSGAVPVVRKINGKKELIVPVSNTKLIYSITW